MSYLDVKKNFGENFKSIRIKLGLSQKKFGGILKSNQSSIAKIERGGKESLFIEELFILKNELKIDLNQLVVQNQIEMPPNQTIIGNHNSNNVQIVDSQAEQIAALKEALTAKNELIGYLKERIKSLEAK